MSWDGVRQSGPRANLLCRFGTGWRDKIGSSNKTQSSREATRERHPGPGPQNATLACQAGFYHGAWMHGENHSSARAPAPAGSPRPSRDTAPAPSANPPCLPGWPGERPPGWGGVLGLPNPGPSPPQGEGAWMAVVWLRDVWGCLGMLGDGRHRLLGKKLEGPRSSAPSPKPPVAGDGGCRHCSSRTHRQFLSCAGEMPPAILTAPPQHHTAGMDGSPSRCPDGEIRTAHIPPL